MKWFYHLLALARYLEEIIEFIFTDRANWFRLTIAHPFDTIQEKVDSSACCFLSIKALSAVIKAPLKVGQLCGLVVTNSWPLKTKRPAGIG